MRFVNYLIFGAVMIALLAGTSFAVTNVSVTQYGNLARWAGTASATTLTTEGGNLSSINISATSLTDKWAAFFGNVSGTITLQDASSTIFSWTYSVSGGGKVCASPSSSFPTGTLSNASSTTINSLWSLGSSDNATNTLISVCSYPSPWTLNGYTVTTPVGITHTGSSNFRTCAVQTGTSAKTNYLFCTNISNTGINFQGFGYNYEVMVPTTPGTGVENYYLYAELS